VQVSTRFPGVLPTIPVLDTERSLAEGRKAVDARTRRNYNVAEAQRLVDPDTPDTGEWQAQRAAVGPLELDLLVAIGKEHEPPLERSTFKRIDRAGLSRQAG
jgi:hypothetical protein